MIVKKLYTVLMDKGSQSKNYKRTTFVFDEFKPKFDPKEPDKTSRPTILYIGEKNESMEDFELRMDFAGQSIHRQITKENEVSSAELLRENGFTFESHKEGMHLAIESRVDFWPGTGKYRDRKSNKQGRGIFPLMDFLRKIKNESK